jgi:hypothetical protein
LPEPWSARETTDRLEAIVATGAANEQQALFRDVERFARMLGFDDVIDSWEPDLGLLRGEKGVSGDI